MRVGGYKNMDNYKFMQNKRCEYFPCHKGIAKEEFNCLFCYCPLYPLKDKCGGNYTYLENGIKSCMNCNKPHTLNGYEHIQKQINCVIELGKIK